MPLGLRRLPRRARIAAAAFVEICWEMTECTKTANPAGLCWRVHGPTSRITSRRIGSRRDRCRRAWGVNGGKMIVHKINTSSLFSLLPPVLLFLGTSTAANFPDLEVDQDHENQSENNP